MQMGDIVIFHSVSGDCPAIVLADLAGGLLDIQFFSLMDGSNTIHEAEEGTSIGQWSARS